MAERITVTHGTNERLARVLTSAIEKSGMPRYEIAGSAGLHRETLVRALNGIKPIPVEEAIRILRACEVPPNTALFLATAGYADLASEWLHGEMGCFLEEFLIALPPALNESLGDRARELRPRWAKGAAQMLAKLLAQHVADLDRRAIAIGERPMLQAAGA